MKFSFRFKLMVSYLLLIALMGGVLYGYLNHALAGTIVDSLRNNLTHQAGLAALMAGQEIADLQRDAPRAALEMGKPIAARVTIVAPTGEVVGDSEVATAQLANLENHLHRPEVQEALRTGTGSAVRYSATLRTDMLYVAVPFTRNGQPAGIIRLALPLTAVEQAKAGIHSILGISLLIALGLALLFSTVLSQLTSRPLRTIAAIAAEIGHGDFRRRLPTHWRDELGELARVMNDMAGRLKEQVETLASERNRLDAILRGMGEGLMVSDASGSIIMVNPAFCDLFGVHDLAPGSSLIDISRHPALNEAYRVVVATRNELQEELDIQLPLEKIIRTHWVPLLENGELHGVVAVFHDISDLKRLEKIRKDFVANVSHELRTPVTVIKGYAETLQEGIITADPERAGRFVAIIGNHAERLASLIGDLLTLSELESGEFALQLQKTSPVGTIRRACSLLEGKAAAKEIVVSQPQAAGLCDVMADQGRFEQILFNLLDNAIKYTPANGRVDITTLEEGEFLTISVSDTGPGIPPQSLPRIFERFYRVDAGRSRDEGGTGLGLSIVKHLVQLHGGSVRVTSSPGKGSTFSFSLHKAPTA
ncbi:MAG TPA: ATP-binding protein [Geobacteraceae bacterium]